MEEDVYKRQVMGTLKAATSVRAASDAVLTGFEKPADQSEAVQKKREEYGLAYYNKYAGTQAAAPQETTQAAAGVPFKVRVEIDDLNIRTGAGTDYAKTGEYKMCIRDSVGNIYQYYHASLAALIAGGRWCNAANAGARCVNCNNYPWNVNTNIGVRGACDLVRAL